MVDIFKCQRNLGHKSSEQFRGVVSHLRAGLDADGEVGQLDPPLLVADVDVPPLAQGSRQLEVVDVVAVHVVEHQQDLVRLHSPLHRLHDQLLDLFGGGGRGHPELNAVFEDDLGVVQYHLLQHCGLSRASGTHQDDVAVLLDVLEDGVHGDLVARDADIVLG